MSEYQYYDFRAIDRALTKAEMAELRSVSTRAVITSSSFTNHYEWGDLKADPLKLLEKYFDTFLYVANWKAEDEANRSRYLDQLGKREEATWNQIAAHIQKRQPNEYDKAVTLLIDLRDLAVRQGRMTAFESALGELRQEHAAKESLLRRLT